MELERRTTESGRVYTDFDTLFLPSVTTVLDELPTPPGLKYWKRAHSGVPDDFDDLLSCWNCEENTLHSFVRLQDLPNELFAGGLWQCTECGETHYFHWEDILEYKTNRGTMIHYRLLNQFADEDMFGENEKESTRILERNGDWEKYESHLEYAIEAFEEIMEIRGITQDSVLDVECFVTNEGIGYAGQFDMLYIDNEGDLVLSDLKTSKSVYEKHQLQLTSYAQALNLDIDKLEVIRIHPDSETWEVSHDDMWPRTRNDLWGEFVSLRTGMGDVEEEFKAIADEGVDDG